MRHLPSEAEESRLGECAWLVDFSHRRIVLFLTSTLSRPFLLLDRYFDGANASAKPIVGTIAVLLLGGYTLEYQHLKHHKNYEH